VKPGIELRRKGNASWIRLGADTQQKEAETANQAAEAWVRMHPKDKPVGGLQVTEGGDLWQEMEHPDGTTSTVQLKGPQGQGIKGKANVAFVVGRQPPSSSNFRRIRSVVASPRLLTSSVSHVVPYRSTQMMLPFTAQIFLGLCFFCLRVPRSRT